MEDKIVFEEKVFQSKHGAYEVFKARCMGEECFCITHMDNGERYSIIFDYDNAILRAITQKMLRTSFSMDKANAGSGFLFKFCRTDREASISVRYFLWAKYNGLPLSKVRDTKIELVDKSLFQFKIMDMRKRNMYYAGGTDADKISIVTDLYYNRKFIVVDDVNRIEYMDYSPGLYHLLTTRRYCTKCHTGKNGRLQIGVKHSIGKKGSAFKNLSRFITMYYEFYGKYENQSKGSFTRFIRNIPYIDESELKGLSCAHLNDCSWNSCLENVMFMDSTINAKAKRNTTLIAGRYAVLPIVWRSGTEEKILVEWSVNGNLKYFVCNDEYDFFDFQQTILGKNKAIANLRMSYQNENGERIQILTPKQSIPTNRPKPISPNREEILKEINIWSVGRQRILDLYRESPGLFRQWERTENGITSGVLENILVLLGMYE